MKRILFAKRSNLRLEDLFVPEGTRKRRLHFRILELNDGEVQMAIRLYPFIPPASYSIMVSAWVFL